MPYQAPQQRFVESRPGAICGALLAALWLAALATAGSLGYMAFPCSVLLVPLVLVAAVAFGSGYKTVRLGWWPWFCLVGAGGYFLVRCFAGYSTYDALNEGTTLLCGLVFYVAGLYLAGAKGSYRLLLWVLGATIALQLAASAGMAAGLSPVWTGKCPVGLNGREITQPFGFFIYKNFAAQVSVALGLAAAVYACIARGRAAVWLALAGLLSLGWAFMLPSRAAWGLVPAGACIAWIVYPVACASLHRRVGWVYIGISIVALVAAGGAVIAALHYGIPDAAARALDSHDRLGLANYASQVPREGGVKWFGTGARTFLWEVLPVYHWGRFLPNYAHNEYIQARMDYGLVGFALTLVVLFGHLAAGARRLSLLREARPAALTAMALVVVGVAALHGCMDFIWHHAALVSLTAFCLGILAAPCGTPCHPLKAQGGAGKAILAMGALAVAFSASWIAWQLAPGWIGQWRYAQSVAAGEAPEASAAVLGRVAERYPDPTVAVFYARCIGKTAPDPGTMERVVALLGRAEAHNPRQAYAAYARAAYLDVLGRHEEAEAVLRRMCGPRGIESWQTYSWRALYAMHLASWGRRLMGDYGSKGRARSLLAYARNILDNAGFESGDLYGQKERLIDMDRKQQASYLQSLANDLSLLDRLGVACDPSWKLPLEPGGGNALYPQLGEREKRR